MTIPHLIVKSRHLLQRLLQYWGKRTVDAVVETGYMFSLLTESGYWLIAGRRRQEPVRINSLFREAMQIGVNAIPIIAILCFSVGMMLAIQGVAQLKRFGAESEVILGIAWSVTREFSPLIVGILIAGRSGSAIAARIGTMLESQEIDALRVIGINPVRHLAAPILIATLLMVPCLTLLGDLMGMFGGAIYTAMDLQMPLSLYATRSYEILTLDDILQGLIKSGLFALLIALVGLANGFQVHGGAEGVGRATTRAVVTAISLIVITDMLVTYLLTR